MDQSPSSQQALKRRALRAAVWLADVLRYMPDGLHLPKRVQAFIERRLDLLAGFVIHLVFMRAAQHCRPGQRQRNLFAAGRANLRHDVRTQITHNMRATIGGHLRRKLNPRGRGSKHLKARAAAILAAMRTVGQIAARFIRRMKKGLSRRASAHSRVKAAIRPTVAAPYPIVTFAPDACIARAPP